MSGTGRHPIEQFLGLHKGDSPFALLGLDIAPSGDNRILDMLRARLAQVDAHPHRDTPQADEVRLALHAAAAQLLDPEVQRALLDRWKPRVAGAAQQEDEADADTQIEVASVRRDTSLAIAVAGGWNEHSLRVLTALSHARGLDIDRLIRAVNSMQGAEAAPIASGPGEEQPPTGEEYDRPSDPMTGRKPGAPIIIAGAALLALVGVGLGIALLTDPGDRPAAPVPAPGQSSSAPATPSRPVADGSAQETPTTPNASGSDMTRGPSIDSATDVIDAIRTAIGQMDLDAALADEDFVDAISASARIWPRFRDDERAAILGAFNQYLIAIAPDPERIGAVVRAIVSLLESVQHTKGPGALTERVWLVGVASRIESEPELTASASRVATGAIRRLGIDAAPGPRIAFEHGAREALRLFSVELATVASADLWEAWAGCARAVTRSDLQQRSELLAGAMDVVIGAGGDVAREGPLESLTALASASDWDEPGMRRWLVRAIVSSRVPAAALHVITREVVGADREGILDLSMTLSSSANSSQRAQLRDRYREVWAITEGEAHTGAMRELSDAIAAADLRVRGALGMEDMFSASIECARVGSAGYLLWSGRIAEARELIRRARDGLDSSPPPIPTTPFDDPDPPSNWATRYLSLPDGRPQPKVDMLNELGSRGQVLSMLEAEILTAEAMRSGQREVRTTAYAIIWQRRSQPRVINAILEELPLMPKFAENARLVEGAAGVPLPPVTDPAWTHASRGALVRRLLDALAMETNAAEYDRLASLLAEAYGWRSSAPPGGVADLPPAHEAISVSRQELEAVASGVFLTRWTGPGAADVRARRSAGLGFATTDPQRLFVEQTATIGYLAIVVASERPERSEQALEVLAAFDQSRRASSSVVEQIAIAELAAAKLWLLLLKVENPS